MNIYAALSLLTVLIALATAVYVLFLRGRTYLNFQLVLVCLALIAWSLPLYIIFAFPVQHADLQWLNRISTVGWVLFAPLMFHYFMVLTGQRLEKYWFLTLLNYPIAFFFIWLAFNRGLLVEEFVWLDNVWQVRFDPYNSPPTLLFYFFVASNVIYGIVMVWRWGRRTPQQASKKQAMLISISGTLALSLVFGNLLILPLFGWTVFPSIMHVFILFWVASIWFAMFKYQLMTLSINMASITIIDNIPDLLLLLNRDDELVFMNKQACTQFGFSEGRYQKRQVRDLLHHREILEVVQASHQQENFTVSHQELSLRNPEGQMVVYSVSASVLYDRFNDPQGLALIMRDISAMKSAEEQLKHLAMHDTLTGLPNRLLLDDRLQNALNQAKRYRHLLALLVIDLDDFKKVNDSLGHGAGDKVLQRAASVLKRAVRESDTTARFGGDEFVVLLTNIDDVSIIRTIVERIYEINREPQNYQGHIITQSMSIGISIYPMDAGNHEQLFRHADLAMYKAKAAAKNNYKFYLDNLDCD